VGMLPVKIYTICGIIPEDGSVKLLRHFHFSLVLMAAYNFSAHSVTYDGHMLTASISWGGGSDVLRRRGPGSMCVTLDVGSTVSRML
jgi:hypothetical protein